MTLLIFNIPCDVIYKYKYSKKEKKEYKIVVARDINPMPYQRATQRSVKSDPRYILYTHWKHHCYFQFVEQIGKHPEEVLKPKIKYHLFCKSFFKDNRKGDSENIAKGVGDSIFINSLQTRIKLRKKEIKIPRLNDNNVIGADDFFKNELNPHCEIVICSDEKNLRDSVWQWLHLPMSMTNQEIERIINENK